MAEYDAEAELEKEMFSVELPVMLQFLRVSSRRRQYVRMIRRRVKKSKALPKIEIPGDEAPSRPASP